MNIEKLREMNWKEKRDLAETTADMNLLIALADDKSVYVRREILYRLDAPFKAIEKVYDNSKSSKERGRVFDALSNLEASEELRKLLSKIVSDADYEISRKAVRMYREKFQTLKSKFKPIKDIKEVTDLEILEDWAIKIPGYGEQGELARNPNLTGENAHKYVVTLCNCERSLVTIQKYLYEVLSHDGILPKTVQYVFDNNFRQNLYQEEFFTNPRFAVVSCKEATLEMLTQLMDLQEKEVELCIKCRVDMSNLEQELYKFSTALVSNPKCDKALYDRAFDWFVKNHRLEWSNYVCKFASSEHISKEQLIYILRNHKSGYLVCKFVANKLNMFTEMEFAEIVKEYSDSTKLWIKENGTDMPKAFLSYL